MTPSRLEQFADGIFAISATLLVLNFAVPELVNPGNRALGDALLAQWPKLLAFLLSFFIILNYWRLHSAMFHGVRVLDHTTILLNTAFLVVAAFMPYATNVAGAYPTLPAAAVLYSVVLLTGALIGFFMVRHLISSGAYLSPIPPETCARDLRPHPVLALHPRGRPRLRVFLPDRVVCDLLGDDSLLLDLQRNRQYDHRQLVGWGAGDERRIELDADDRAGGDRQIGRRVGGQQAARADTD